jgi:hypothetical protein
MVSSYGRMKSCDRYLATWYGKRLAKGKILQPVESMYGYLCVTLEGRQRRLHCVVLEAFRGLRPAGMIARHLDGDRRNNHISNLRWGTSRENEADKIWHGTIARGERNGLAKLTAKDVRRIRKSNEQGIELARRLSVSPSLISCVRLGKVWGHLQC